MHREADFEALSFWLWRLKRFWKLTWMPVREAPLKLMQFYLGIARWGGLNHCQDGLGHLCSENWSSNWHLLMLRRVSRLARMLCGTYKYKCTVKWRSDEFAEIRPKKVPQSARFSAGRGVQSLFGQCLNTGASILLGLPVLPKSKSMSTCIIFGQKKFDLKHRWCIHHNFFYEICQHFTDITPSYIWKY